MKEYLDKLVGVLQFLDPYPAWIKVLVGLWILFTASLLVGLVLARPGTNNDASSRTKSSSPDVAAYKAGSLSAVITAESVHSLREKTGVRVLRPLENDLHLSELPPGVYGFTVPWIINTDPTGVVGGTGVDRITLDESSGGTGVMEIDKGSNGESYVVGYISEGDLVRLQNPLRSANAELQLFFSPFREYSIPVAIPLSRIQRSRNRRVADQYVNDLSVR